MKLIQALSLLTDAVIVVCITVAAIHFNEWKILWFILIILITGYTTSKSSK